MSSNMWKNKKIIGIGILVLVIGGILVWQKEGGNNDQPSGPENIVGAVGGEIVETSEGGTVGAVGQVYKNTLYGFSIVLPKDFHVGEFIDGPAGTILVNGLEGYQLQIYVSDFDENIVITPERIKRDLPSLVMEEVVEVPVGDISGTAFISTNENGQKFREIWFAKNYKLFQVTTMPEGDDNTGNIMQSWQWL